MNAYNTRMQKSFYKYALFVCILSFAGLFVTRALMIFDQWISGVLANTLILSVLYSTIITVKLIKTNRLKAGFTYLLILSLIIYMSLSGFLARIGWDANMFIHKFHYNSCIEVASKQKNFYHISICDRHDEDSNFAILLYDESDKVSRSPLYWDKTWRNQVESMNCGFGSSKFGVQPLSGHFYVVTFFGDIQDHTFD